MKRGPKEPKVIPMSYEGFQNPDESVTRCSYAGCHSILFKGSLGFGTNAEFECQRCKRKYRIVVTKAHDEEATTCPYAGCDGLLFRGKLHSGTDAEFQCQCCGRRYRIKVL